MQRVVSNLNGSQALHFAVPVDVLELGEVELFLSQDAIVAELVARLLLVELVLEDMDLAIELLKLVEERSLVRCYDQRLLAFALLILVAVTHDILLVGYPFQLLYRILLRFDLIFTRVFIKLAGHKVLIRMEILVKIDNLVDMHFVWLMLDSIRDEPLRLLLIRTLLHICKKLFLVFSLL